MSVCRWFAGDYLSASKAGRRKLREEEAEEEISEGDLELASFEAQPAREPESTAKRTKMSKSRCGTFCRKLWTFVRLIVAVALAAIIIRAAIITSEYSILFRRILLSFSFIVNVDLLLPRVQPQTSRRIMLFQRIISGHNEPEGRTVRSLHIILRRRPRNCRRRPHCRAAG